MKRVHFAAATRILALALATALAAASSTRAGGWSNWSASWENDTFVPSQLGSDEFYTNGIRFSIVRSPTWKWANSFGDFWINMPFFGVDADYRKDSALVMGQNLFTPSVITTFDINPDDRPYAAFLYGGARVDLTESQKRRVQHSFEFDVGVMGPPALGGQTQSAVHVLRKTRIPKGWDSQLGTEVAMQVLYQLRGRYGTDCFDVTPHGGFALGTIQTYGYAGVTLRLGVHLSGFPGGLNPWTVAADDAEPPRKFEFAVFAGTEGRAFARNAFLDGNLVGGSPGVDKRWDVYDWRYGLSVRYTSWRIVYTMVRRSKEFEPPPNSGLPNGFHNYGNVSLSREFGAR